MKADFFLMLCLAGPALACPIASGGEWQELAPIPTVRQEHVTVALSHSSFAILGGIVPSRDSLATTDLVHIYDIAENTWRLAAPLPLPINHGNGAAFEGKIYLLGGLVVAPDGDWDATPDSWVYDEKRNSWTGIAPAPASSARGAAAVGVYNKTIYLAGGVKFIEARLGGQQATIDTVTAFDTVAGKWIALPHALAHSRRRETTLELPSSATRSTCLVGATTAPLRCGIQSLPWTWITWPPDGLPKRGGCPPRGAGLRQRRLARECIPLEGRGIQPRQRGCIMKLRFTIRSRIRGRN